MCHISEREINRVNRDVDEIYHMITCDSTHHLNHRYVKKIIRYILTNNNDLNCQKILNIHNYITRYGIFPPIITVVLTYSDSDSETEFDEIDAISLDRYIIEDGDDVECSLCQDNITEKKYYKLPCNHSYHHSLCLGDKNITNWFSNHNTCPMCRYELTNSQ